MKISCVSVFGFKSIVVIRLQSACPSDFMLIQKSFTHEISVRMDEMVIGDWRPSNWSFSLFACYSFHFAIEQVQWLQKKKWKTITNNHIQSMVYWIHNYTLFIITSAGHSKIDEIKLQSRARSGYKRQEGMNKSIENWSFEIRMFKV